MKNFYQNKRRQAGFSLIELMIVIAILGLLIGVGVPAWRYMIRNGNETAAITAMQQIVTNQANYRSRSGGSFAASFSQLTDPKTGTGFNEAFAGEKPTVNGYVFELKTEKGANGKATKYSVNASPESDSSGTRHFYIDSDKGNIRFNDSGPADASSPILTN